MLRRLLAVAVLSMIAALVIEMMPDIRRYVKIRSM
jgi:hypothetical protein